MTPLPKCKLCGSARVRTLIAGFRNIRCSNLHCAMYGAYMTEDQWLLLMGDDWRTDMENAPRHTEVEFFREDMGVAIGQYTNLTEILNEAEIEQSGLDDEEIYELDYWIYTKDTVERMSNSGLPTHWKPITPPEVK